MDIRKPNMDEELNILEVSRFSLLYTHSAAADWYRGNIALLLTLP